MVEAREWQTDVSLDDLFCNVCQIDGVIVHAQGYRNSNCRL